MTYSRTEIQELHLVLQKDFLTEASPAPADLEAVKSYLTKVISYLLDKDMNRLLNIFYRIDLREDKVRTILTQAPVETIAAQLAELVIEREMEKVRTRLKYKNF